MIQVIVMERMAIMARNGGEAQAGVGVEVSLPERNCGNIAATANHDLAATLQVEAEQKQFPEGFEPGRNIVDLATEETRTYFLVTYNLEAKP
jgi:hypothetical protein